MECCGSCFPRSKKSFKTSGIPAEPPSHTKAPSVNRAPPSNGSTTTHSNGAPPSPSNSFSSTSFSSTHSGGEAPRATGQRTLEITLPAGTTITSTVDAKLQMMDLLVMIAAKNKLNPTGHVILPATADRTDIAQFKASQRIGELDTTILQIVPKLSRGEIISIRTSDKKKAAQFEQTVRLTVLSGKNHKALFRVNPEKPIQDFLPQVYEERGIEANECRLRLVKTPEEDIDYSKSLNHYGGVNELVLIDLRPPPPQEPELVPIEKKKKSMFGRKSKKKGEGEPLSLTPTKEAAPPEPSQAPPAARQPSLDSTEGTDNNTLKKRRPAPPPPGGKKEPTHDEQLLKPSMEGVSRSAQGVSKKRRAPAPPPAGSAPPIPLVDPIPEVTVNHGSESPSLSDQGRHISFGATEVIESPLSTPTSTPADTPADTPESTLERRKKDGGDATATGDDIQVEVSLAELDEVLDEDIPPPPDYAPPPPPVFDPPPPPDEPPSPGEPQEDVDRLIQEGRLVLSPGVGLEDNDTTSECSSDHDLASSLCASATSSLIKSMEDAFEEALAVGRESLTNDATAEQEVSVSQVNIASIDQSVPEDPESGEKVRIDSTNQDEDTTEASTDETQANISEQTADDNKAALSPLLLTSNSNNQLDSECGLTKPSQKIQLTTISNDEPTKPVPKPRIVKISQSSDESHPDTSRDRSVSDANRGQGAPVPKPRITRFSSEPQLDTPNKESTDASKKAMTKQKSADQISGRYKKRKAPRRPPPLVLSLDKEDESALSALQSAFLEAFSKQPGSKTATAPVMKLRPSRAPPLPPTFRKDRSSSTNDVKSIKSVQFAPDLKQPGVIQQSKSIDDPQGMSKPVAPVRRKKKTSSDSVSDQHSSPDKVAVESTERLPTPAIRARKSTKKAEVTSDNRVEGKPPVKSVGSQENPNRFEVEVEIVAPPRQAQEDKLCPVALGSTEKTTGQQSTLGQDTCTTKDKGATPTSSKEKPIEVASPAVVQAMPESNPDLSRSLSGELEDTLKSRLMQLHKSMKFEESFDTINSSDDVFLDETFGDPPSEPDAHSSEQLTTSRDSADVQQTDSFNHEEKGEGISFGTNDLKEKELEEEEMVGEMSSGFESECVSTEAVVVESSPNLVIPKHKDTTTDIKEKRAALTKMMKLSLDEDSKETTSYSPTPQGEDSESMLEEKSLTALAGGVTREAVGDQTLQVNKDKTKDTVEESLSLEKEKEEETVEEKEKEKKEGEEKTNVEEKKDVEVHEVTKQQDEIAKAEQPNMEQLAEQYKQLQQQMAMLQQQLVLNPTSASAPMQMNPAMAYQTQQMQQMQQQMILQQQMFMQQQQQAMGGYVMVPQPGGGNVMVPGQPGGGMMMSPPQMMYTPMGVQPLPAYGQVTPPQVVATPAVDQQDSPAKSVADETDSGVKEEPKETSRDQPDEVTHQETPLKPPTDAQATASGRRNVFADILKKKNAPKSSYVLSAQREAQRQRSDSNSSLTSSTSSKEGTAAAALSVETPKLELRTETSPTRHDSPVTNGLSPTSSEPSVSSVEDPPTSPPIATSLSNNFSLNISNNNTSKTMTLNAETSQPEATKDTPTSPPPAAPISSQGSRKVPPAIRPKPQKGPRPFRPASTYGKVSAPENEEGYSSSHVRKVTDLRSMFMLGK
ncbi:protein piccolo isoform X3 [Strongylocentrotus purpuratus]|uniref:Cordon-bleu ubiquitin-like domain-containing protein n=1 Tax=Strongylocentrotus purpuratus TaxID=7668 RepID=A0A7M7STC0_STRPU|nr:protein piccolo isoform X3 [Strongylocentrotus purpuratus]